MRGSFQKGMFNWGYLNYNLFYNKLCGLFAKFAQFKRTIF